MNVISLFSGIGGFDLGFHKAGCRIVWANDIWEDAVETYGLNFKSPIVLKDVSKVDVSDIPDADIVIGGFPCQGFSLANNKRTVSDKRNLLYRQFLRVLREKRPPLFLAENVKGILSLGGGLVFKQILKDFSNTGYNVRHAVLNAADFGVPQRRERVFIFGTRRDISLPDIAFPPMPTHRDPRLEPKKGMKPWVGVGHALKDIPEPGTTHNLENHEATQYKMRFNGFIGHRVIDPELPSPTITARGDDRGGVVIHHHPSNKRRMSAREVAIVQSFPVSFKFHGCKTSVYRQVANAVPPGLAYAVAQPIVKAWSRLAAHSGPRPSSDR